MNTEEMQNVVVARPRITLLMLMCGLMGAASIGAASAATAEADVPSLVVHFDPSTLSTEAGVKALYRRIENAAAQVCPDTSDNPHFVGASARQCREQSIARAVYKINNERLVAVYNTNVKRG